MVIWPSWSELSKVILSSKWKQAGPGNGSGLNSNKLMAFGVLLIDDLQLLYHLIYLKRWTEIFAHETRVTPLSLTKKFRDQKVSVTCNYICLLLRPSSFTDKWSQKYYILIASFATFCYGYI